MQRRGGRSGTLSSGLLFAVGVKPVLFSESAFNRTNVAQSAPAGTVQEIGVG